MSRPSKGDVRDDGYYFLEIDRKGYETWLAPKTWHKRYIQQTWKGAERRALKKGLPFSIDMDYLLDIFPEDCVCPIFHTKMTWGGNKFTSPSLDRIHPALGYVQGNVMWISDYANTLKNGNSLDTLKRLVTFYEDILKGTNG